MKPFSLNLRGRLMEFRRPVVMGILNVTDNSFHAPSRVMAAGDVAERARQLLAQGAGILDIGGCSTRPGSEPVDEAEELQRVCEAIEAVKRVLPEAVVSVDTFRANVAREAAGAGADIINDVSAFTLDPSLEDVVAGLRLPYILTHPARSSLSPDTPDDAVTATVIRDLQAVVRRLAQKGVADIIVDPGLGFGKTLRQNFILLGQLERLAILERPLLVGVSRKSMISRVIGGTSADALNGTTVLDTLALDRGASMLRVHDPAPAAEAIALYLMATGQEATDVTPT